MTASLMVVMVLLLANIFLMVYLISIAKTDAIEAFIDPLNYGARKLSNDNGVPVSCSCNLLSNKLTPTLWFDGHNMSLEQPKRTSNNSDFFDINLSGIIKFAD